MNRLFKGRTNNHLSWVMVDATDFATPESALSAAMKIKIYGKLRSATGVNFVTSGTGSLTNDIQHVGASVLGIYTIALAKADLSDASAAWYDQYIVSLSSTGAAYQALVCEGVIDDSNISGLISDIQSAVAIGNSRVLLAQSMASDAASAAAQTNSRVLLIQSRLSDFNSAFVSQLSDLRSDLASFMTTTGVGLNASAISDLRSAIAAGPAATVTASDISDIASAVWANTIGARVDSRILVAQSFLSDIRSHVSDLQSDFQSRVPKRVATDSQLSDMASDLKSAIAAITATVSASDISDIASAVWANTIGARVDSRILVGQSYLSDIRSHVSDLQSDFQSRVPKRVATDSQLSDLASDLRSYLVVMSGVQSDIYSAVSNINSLAIASPTGSDIASKVWADTIGARVDSRLLLVQSRLSDLDSRLVSDVSDIRSAIAGITASVSASDISDIASAVWANTIGARVDSRILVGQSYLSDIRSHVSDLQSDFQSRVPKRVATDSQLSDMASDLKSAIAGVAATVSASDISDIASAVWANTIGARVDSRLLLNQSRISDIASFLVVMSGVLSDAYSGIVVGNSRVLVAQSGASDAASAAQQANSRVLVVQSMVSDTQSKLSDVESNLLSFLLSPGVQLNPSTMSDLRSAVNAVTVNLTASDISDIASAVLAGATGTVLSASDMSDIASRVWAMAEPQTLLSRVLVAQSYLSDIRSHVSDLQSDFQSRVPKRVATDSQLSDLTSDVKSAVTVGNSRLLLQASAVSDIASVLSDLQSDFQSRVPKRVATDSQVSDLMSDVKSAVAAGGLTTSTISDIASAVRASLDSDLSDILSGVRKGNSQLLVNQSVLSDVQSAVALIPATKLTQHAAAVLAVVIGSGSTTTAVKLSTIEGGAPSAVDDFYNGRVIIFTSGALAGQATSISDYTGSTTTATVVALTGAPVNAVTAVIV